MSQLVVLLLDSEENECYPQTLGDAITVKFGAGTTKAEIKLDTLLETLFTRVITNIEPEDGVTTPNIGTKDKPFGTIYCTTIEGNITGDTANLETSVETKKVVASEQIQINGITLTKNSAGRLASTVGIEGAVWN